MYYFVEVSCVVAELIIFHLFARSLFKIKTNSKWLLPVSYILFGIVIVVLSFITEAAILRIIFSTVGFILILYLLFDVKFFAALFASLAFMTIYALTDIVVMLGFSLFDINIQELVQYGNVRSLFIIIAHIVLLGIIVGVSLLNKRKQGIISPHTLIPMLPSWISSIVLCCILVMQAYQTATDFHPLYLVVILGLMYTSILIIYFVNRIREQDRIKHETELWEQHYALEREYYDQFHAQQEQTRALWHDISKYMRAMQSLVGEAESQKAEENLAQVQTMLGEIRGVVDVNNRVVNVILNEYMNLARNNGIELWLDVQIPTELFVPVSDLYVILGNTLDNSINACTELEVADRYISIQLKQHNDILYYRIENPYSENHLSRKKDGVHGYGLRNVVQCAEKYGGAVETISDNGVFTVIATLNAI